MSARRFFVAGEHTDGATIAITGADAHKIAHVLRLKTGDRIEVIDSRAVLFVGEVNVDGAAVAARLSEGTRAQSAQRVRVDVAQGVPKGQKMDFVVEKLSELGVGSLLPMITERSVARDVGEAKLERWRRLAKAAAAQSGRAELPFVEPQRSFEQIIARFAEYDVVLFAWEAVDATRLRDTLPAVVSQATSILVVVGPEGGFSHAEAEAAKSAGAHLISLGARILRTETAALALLAILQYVVA